MIKMIDSFLHSSSLGRIIPSAVKRKKSMGIFDIDDELPPVDAKKTDPSTIQVSGALVQRMALLKIHTLPNQKEIDIISYGDGLLEQLQTLHCQLLGGEVSQTQLQTLEKTLDQLPNLLNSTTPGLNQIIMDIQVRVAVELAKLSINR